MSSSDIFASGTAPNASVSTNRVPSVEIRLYRIKDPVSFFTLQKNLHSPVAENSPQYKKSALNTREATSGFLKIFHRRYRNVFRSLTKEDARKTLVSAYGIEKQQNVLMAASFPVLKEYEHIKTWVYKAPKGKDDGYNSGKIPLPVREKGVYLVEGIYKNLVAYTVVLVSDIRFISKETDAEQVVFVCKSATGEPVPGADVVFQEKVKEDDEKKDEEANGKERETVTVKTDKQGIARFKKNEKKTFNFFVRSGADFLLSEPYTYSSGWDKYKVYIYTDRPVYRPGHTVYFKAVLRERKNDAYESVQKQDARVKVMDARDNVLYEKTLSSNEWGSLEGSFELPDEPPLGRYSIELALSEDLTYYGSFQVEEYRKPEYKVTVQTEKKSYVSGDVVTVSAEARYYFGEPVRDAKVSYFVYRSPYEEPWWMGTEYEWYYAGEEEYGYYYDFQLYDKGEGTVDENGKFSFTFKTKGQGEDSLYKIAAKVEDKSHRSVEGNAFAKVSMGTFHIFLDRDKYVYTKGETVRLSVSAKDILGNTVSRRVKIKAVRTQWLPAKKVKEGKYEYWKYEKKETIISVKSLKTKKSGKISVRIPVRENGEYSFVAVSKDERGNKIEEDAWAYVSDYKYSFYSDTKDVELTADKNMYHVDDTAKLLAMLPSKGTHLFVTVEGSTLYEHRVLNAGNQSEILTFALKKEYAPNVYVKVQFVLNGKFYEGTEDIVVLPDDRFLTVDVQADKKEYKPGENAHLRISVKDARGNPVEADVSAGIVDESIYAIQKELTPDIRQFFYGHRWNSVNTDYSYDFYFSGYSVAKEAKLKSKAKDNRISWADVKGKKETKIRKRFLDTMYWNAMLRTNKNGIAEVDVPCPDNLTTWRVTVRAATLDTRVGQVTNTFLSRKDLLVRLVLPRFFRQRDTLTFQTIVHNYLKNEKTVQVRLETEGLDIKENKTREIFVEKGKDASLVWNASVTSSKSAVVRAWAETDEESDAMEVNVPVLPHGRKTISAVYASVKDADWEKEFTMDFPEQSVKDTRRVKIFIAPSLMGPVYASLDYLIHYPYGCTEQTMSSFLPAVVVNDMVKELGIALNPDLQKRLPDVVYKGMNRLYDFQHYDGGWGWWQNDETNDDMTAYVMVGLSIAKKAGVKINGEMFENGVSMLNELLQKESLSMTTRLYILYALSLSGNLDASMIMKIYDERASWKKTNAYGLSLMALMLKAQKLDKQAKDVSNVILKQAACEGNFVYWQGKKEEYWWEDDTIEMTAFALKALVNAAPDAPEIPSIVAYLMAKQKGAQWNSTRDTSAVLHALADYIRHTGELSADFSVELSLNGSKVKQVAFSKKDVFGKPVEFELDAKDLHQKNTVRVAKKGQGMLYANMVKEFYADEENMSPLQKTFNVKREYFLLKPKKQDEEWVYKPEPLRRLLADVGDEILVKLTVKSEKAREYFMLEDYFPAGCEVLKNKKGYRIQGYEYDDPEIYEWRYFWSQHEVRDEKIAFFVTYFPKGEHTFTYIMRPEMSGNYHVMPAEASLMYFPEAFSASGENVFNIED